MCNVDPVAYEAAFINTETLDACALAMLALRISTVVETGSTDITLFAPNLEANRENVPMFAPISITSRPRKFWEEI